MTSDFPAYAPSGEHELLEAARQLTYHAAIMSERAMRGEKLPGMTFASSAGTDTSRTTRWSA